MVTKKTEKKRRFCLHPARTYCTISSVVEDLKIIVWFEIQRFATSIEQEDEG